MSALRYVVVDTSVAKACGSAKLEANSPAPECVDALRRILEQKSLGVASSEELRAEWERHAGAYARKWLVSMVARRRFAATKERWRGEAALVAAARDKLSARQAQAVEKDAPIVSLAMVTDQRVLSLDDRQRELLHPLTGDVRALGALHWADPTARGVREWLDAGAPERKSLMVRTSRG